MKEPNTDKRANLTARPTFVPFQSEHLGQLILCAGQGPEQDLIAALDFPMDRIARAYSETALLDGVPVGSAGIVPISAHRAVAFAYVGAAIRRRDWPVITARVTDVLNRAAWDGGYKRIEATAAFGEPAAWQWLERLGFLRETPYPMPLYGPTGVAHYLYSRIRL